MRRGRNRTRAGTSPCPPGPLAALLGLLLLFSALPSVGVLADEDYELTYEGTAHDAATVESVRDRVARLIPGAIREAESLIGHPLERDRCRVQLHDARSKSGRTLKMRVTGRDTLTLLVFVEPILREYLRDDDDIRVTLAHEFIHVIVRQQVAPEVYFGLPTWFREGITNFLLRQGEERLVNGLGKYYKNPYALLGGLHPGTNYAEAEIAGYFFFDLLGDRLGHDGIVRFVDNVLSTGSTDDGMTGFPLGELTGSGQDTRRYEDLTPAERREFVDGFWLDANQRAQAVLARHTAEVAGPLFECMSQFHSGRHREAAGCFQALISEYPDSYAAEIGYYWLAACYRRMKEYDRARYFLEAFIDSEHDFGLLDDARYDEIMIRYRSGGEPETVRRDAENYLRLFPEAKHARDARKLIRSLGTNDGGTSDPE